MLQRSHAQYGTFQFRYRDGIRPTSSSFPQLLKLGVHGKPPLQFHVPETCHPPIIRFSTRPAFPANVLPRPKGKLVLSTGHPYVGSNLIVRSISNWVTDGDSSWSRTCLRAQTCSATATGDRARNACPLSLAPRCRCCSRRCRDSFPDRSSSRSTGRCWEPEIAARLGSDVASPDR